MIVSLGLARIVGENWRYDEWVGYRDGTPTMFVRRFAQWRGCRVDLHRIVGPDLPGCYHTHPAWAIRVILRGGYVEEMADGTQRVWRPGMFGIVRPSLAHRVEALNDGVESWSLWLRAPKRHSVELVGPGWAAARAEWDALVADLEAPS